MSDKIKVHVGAPFNENFEVPRSEIGRIIETLKIAQGTKPMQKGVLRITETPK